MKTLENKKVYVGKYSKEIQEKAFEIGNGWYGTKEIQHVNKPFLYFRGSEANISFGDDIDYYNNNSFEEVTPEEILAMEVPKKAKTIYDLEIGDRYYRIMPQGVRYFKIREAIQLEIYEKDIKQCNAFISYEEAEKELKRKQAISKIHKYCNDNDISREYGYDYDHDFSFCINEDGILDYEGQGKNGNPIGYFNDFDAKILKEKFEEELKLILSQ